MQSINKRTLTLKAIAIIVVLCATLLGISGGLWWFFTKSQSAEPNWTITDVSRYSEIRNQEWSNRALILHFPDSVPADATDVHFLYSIPFMQSGEYLQLRFKLPSHQIEELLSQYSAVAIHKYRYENITDHIQAANDVPVPIFSDELDGSRLLNVYDILVLGVESKGNVDNIWNHGNTYGVAIDTLTSEILYWAESW